MQDVWNWIVNNWGMAITVYLLAIVFIITYVHRYEVFQKKCERVDSRLSA